VPCIEHELVDGRCEAWAATYDRAGSADAVRDMTTSPNGAVVYAAGETQIGGVVHAVTIAYDAAGGEQRWAAVDGRPEDAYVPVSDIATSPDGATLYVAGGVCGNIVDGSTCDVLLVARDAATGAERWSVIRDGTGHGLDSAQGLAVSDDGSTVYVGGQTYSEATDEDYLAAAFDAGDGEELWTATYDGPGHGFDRGAGVVLADHLLVVSGRSAGADGDDDIATVAFDTREDDAGEIRWATRYDGPGGNDEALAIDTDADGSRIVIAGTSVRTAAPDPFVAAYDGETGAELWTARYNDAGVAVGMAFDVAITPDGQRVVAAGYSQRSDGKGPTTLAYDASTGQRLWVANLLEGSHFAVTTSPDGSRAYVTGGAYTPRKWNMHRTVSYSLATGAQRWFGLYEETAPPESLRSTILYPSMVAMSPDGTHVYVGGTTRGVGGTQDDALTLSYQA
jgi:hypothetical protein